MYAIQDIISGNRRITYAKKGDEVTVIDKKKHHLLLCKTTGDNFITHADNLQAEPLELKEVTNESEKAELKKELRKLLSRDAYQFKIIVNRVYYGKVQKFPKHIDKQTWLELATAIWENSAMGSSQLIDILKANQ